MFGLDDACRLVVARGRLMQRLPPAAACSRSAHRRGVAGLPPRTRRGDGASEVVLSGAAEAIEHRAHPGQAGITGASARRVARVPLALMEPMTAEFAS